MFTRMPLIDRFLLSALARYVQSSRTSCVKSNQDGMIRHMNATLREPLESVQQTAARLGVRRRKVYDLIASGDLPAYRIGGQIRISPQAVADWLVRHQTGPLDGKQ